MLLRLQIPRLVFGSGAIDALATELASLSAAKPLLITDQGLVKCGAFERVVDRLGPNPSFAAFDRVPENPTFEGVDLAAEMYCRARCDAVVAVGGGSVIDTAKLVAVLGGHSGRASDYVGHSEKITGSVVPLIVLPTTAGTGSEASPDAGIHPDAHSISSGITSAHVVPKVAICDPDLTLTLPAWLTAATGLDALSHCIEGYLSKTVSPPVDAMALDGIRRVCGFLRRATSDGSDRDARWQVMMGAFEGGAAIAKGLGPAHAIAISCSDQGFHHGILSILGLIASAEVMQQHAPERMADIAAAMGVSHHEGVADALGMLVGSLGLPVSLNALGYVVDDVDALALRAAQSHFNISSPYAPDQQEFSRMISRIMK